MAPTPGWQEIPQHTLTLRALGSGASIVLVADQILPKTAVIGFDVSITIPDDCLLEPLKYRRRMGMYSSLDAFRSELCALRQGESAEPHLSLVGLDVVIYQHQRGVRTGLCVEGVASSMLDQKVWPWPKRERAIGDRLLLDAPLAYCLRFAFKTSLVDPPYIDEFIHPTTTRGIMNRPR